MARAESRGNDGLELVGGVPVAEDDQHLVARVQLLPAAVRGLDLGVVPDRGDGGEDGVPGGRLTVAQQQSRLVQGQVARRVRTLGGREPDAQHRRRGRGGRGGRGRSLECLDRVHVSSGESLGSRRPRSTITLPPELSHTVRQR